MNIESDCTAGYMKTLNKLYIKQETFVCYRMANVPRM